MEPDVLILILLVLGACAGLFLAVKRVTRLGNRAQAGHQPSQTLTTTDQQTQVLPVAGPSVAVLVEPADNQPLVVGPAPVIQVGPSPDGSVVVEPSSEPTLVIGPAAPVVVEPPPRGVWDERGWTRRSDNGRTTYEGEYQVVERWTGRPRRFRGRMTVNRGSTTPYIANPPPEVKRHPKGPCFILMKAPWFRIDWQRPATNVDDAILYVEKVLDEALNGRRS